MYLDALTRAFKQAQTGSLIKEFFSLLTSFVYPNRATNGHVS